VYEIPLCLNCALKSPFRQKCGVSEGV